jgi:hypothetical protein
MGLFSLEKLFGITIRESANDGSDFTNPDADYRRLFLGEDGQLHVKDSAGAVTDIGTATGGGGGRGEFATKYNPDHETPSTAVALQEEFNGSHGMAWDSAPATSDVTTYPGFLRFKGASAERYLTKAWTPGASDITIACKLSAALGTAWGSIALMVGSATGNPADGVYVIWQPNDATQASVALFNRNSSSFSQVAFVANGEKTRAVYDSMYLRLTRAITGPVWTAHYSSDGVTWSSLATTGSKALTVASFGIRLDSSTSDWKLDWIRCWTSIVEKVGA